MTFLSCLKLKNILHFSPSKSYVLIEFIPIKKNIYSSGTSVSLLFNLFSNTPFVIHIKLSFVISNIFACRRQLIMNTAVYRRTSSFTPKKHLVCCFHYVICCTRFCSSCSAYIINLLQPGV